jgi:chromosome segregation ATPase
MTVGVDLAETVAALQAQVDAYQEQVAALAAAVEEHRKLDEEQRTALQAEIEELRVALNAEVKQREALEAKISELCKALKAEGDKQREALEANNVQCAALQQQCAALEQQCAALEQKLTERTRRVKVLEGQRVFDESRNQTAAVAAAVAGVATPQERARIEGDVRAYW